MCSVFREWRVSLRDRYEENPRTTVHEADTNLIIVGRCSEVAQ